MSMERYPRLLKDASPEFPIHFLNIYSGVRGAVTGGALKYGRDCNGYNQAYASCMQAHGYTIR